MWRLLLPLNTVTHTHTHIHTHTAHPSGRVISPSQKTLPNNTQKSQETDIHAPDGIRTSNSSKWAAADSHLNCLTTGTGAFNNTRCKWISVVHVKDMHQPQINITANEMCNFTKEVRSSFSQSSRNAVFRQYNTHSTPSFPPPSGVIYTESYYHQQNKP